MTSQELTVGDVPVRALRVTFVGELGWELYASSEYGATLWETLWAAGEPFGLVAGGYRAIESMRLEKGYRVWGTDLTGETTPYEAGLGFCVKLDKPVPRPRRAASRPRPPGSAGGCGRSCSTIRHSVVLGGEPVRIAERGRRPGDVRGRRLHASTRPSPTPTCRSTRSRERGSRSTCSASGSAARSSPSRCFDPAGSRVKGTAAVTARCPGSGSPPTASRRAGASGTSRPTCCRRCYAERGAATRAGVAVLLPPAADPRRPAPASGRRARAGARRRRGRRPGSGTAPTAIRSTGGAARGPRRLGTGAGARGARPRPAAAGRLPGHAGAQHRARRDADPAPARRGRAPTCTRRRRARTAGIRCELHPGSRLAAVCGERLQIATLSPPGRSTGSAPASTACGWADDGTVEAVELPERTWVLRRAVASRGATTAHALFAALVTRRRAVPRDRSAVMTIGNVEALWAQTVFSPVPVRNAFEVTVERLAQSIRLGVLVERRPAAARARARRDVRRQPGDPARGDQGAARRRPGRVAARPRRRHVRGRRRSANRARSGDQIERVDRAQPSTTPWTCAGWSSPARPRWPPAAPDRRRPGQPARATWPRPPTATPATRRLADSRLHLAIAAAGGSALGDRGGRRRPDAAGRAAAGDPGDPGQHRPLRQPARGDRRGDPRRAGRRGPAPEMEEHVDGTAALLRGFLS